MWTPRLIVMSLMVHSLVSNGAKVERSVALRTSHESLGAGRKGTVGP
jgi:hypothetical protein